MKRLRWAAQYHREISDERGNSIALTFFVVLITASLAMVAYLTIVREASSTSSQIMLAKAGYLAEAGIEVAMRRMTDGQQLSGQESTEIGDGTFLITYSKDGANTIVQSTGYVGSATKRLRLTAYYRPPIDRFAIYSTDYIDRVTALDEDRNPDPTLAVAYADSLPPIDYNGLIDLAISQSHVRLDATFSPSDGYPNGSFWYSPGVPNVTHVTGNFKVNGGRSVYGIFIIEGDATLNGSSRVVGVVYLQNPGYVVIHGGGDPSESTVTGGIVANGPIDGTSNHITVEYNAQIMSIFGHYEQRENAVRVIAWEEL
jgi:hypothetical protein